MYVTRGMSAAPRVPAGVRFIPIPRGFRGLGDSCPAGQVLTNKYDGTQQCCGAPGTPPQADPCSILNNPAFLAAQAADVGPVDSFGVPLSAGNGAGAAELRAVAGYPQNVQKDAIDCWTNPGLVFTDDMGIRITCPAARIEQAPGIFVSAYSAGELAAMLAPSATPATETAANVAGTPLSFATHDPTAVPPVSGSNFPITVRLVNSSGGSNSSFKVGDSWQIVVTGPPNAQVAASATQNGASLGTSNMGVINSQGQLVLTGTMTAAQVGNWVEAWTVSGQSAGSIFFAVAAASGAPAASSGGFDLSSIFGGGGSTPTPASGSVSSLLSSTVNIGGFSIPALGLAAALGALWFFGGKR